MLGVENRFETKKRYFVVIYFDAIARLGNQPQSICLLTLIGRVSDAA